MTDETEPQATQSADDLPVYDPEQELAAKLDELESQENAAINVYRQLSGNNSKMPFLFTVPVDKFTIPELQQYIRDNYGGGDFRIHIRANQRVVANKLISVEAPKESAPTEQQRQNELAPIVEKMQERMDAMQQRFEDRMQQVQSQPQQPQQDPMEMVAKMVGVMSQMQGMMGGPTEQKPEKSLLEQIEEAEKISERFGKSQQPESDFASLVKEGLGPLIQLAQAEASKRSGEQPKPNPSQATNGEQKAMSQADPETVKKYLGPLASHIRMLITAAKKGTDPDPYASMVLDFTPEEQYSQLYEFLNSDGCLDAIIHAVPEVGEHRDWFDGLRMAILADLDVDDGGGDTGGHVADRDPSAGADEPGDPDGPPAGAVGHAQDAPGHVADGEGGEGHAAGT